MTLAQAMDVWQRAVQEELGLVVVLEDKKDMTNIRPLLYKARQVANNPEYENLVICLPGDAPNELIIVKKTVELD